MIKRILLIPFLALTLIIGLTPNVFAAIDGSAHDFGAETWSGNQICKPCHTPHNASTTVPAAPLWNHTITAATFTLYVDGGTLDATDLTQPTGVSKLCLSCHDGTVAVDAMTGVASPSEFISGPALIGTDLSKSHPISFTYNTALATTDGELFNPSTALSGVGTGTIAQDMLFGASNNKLECASCHDVHNSYGVQKLLVKSNASSALCLTCHDK
ncbi:MAG: cytochrome C [Desulfobacterium sp.]|nr:cytochrome C [Desulfobacterium sp.]